MTIPLLSLQQAHLIHLAFEWLAMSIGFQLYRRERKRDGGASVLHPGSYAIALGCLLGAALGNKLVFWVEFPHLLATQGYDFSAWMSGQSIVGGLLGGLLGVEIAKKLNGVTVSTGDSFLLPLIAGMAIGRVGCFLAGLHDGTYGNPTALPWAVDFGDGIGRHPTQLYDMVFVLMFGALALLARRRWHTKPGLAFKIYLSGYLIWRILVDAIKPVPFDYGGGLSGIQVVCLLALLCYLPFVIKQLLEPMHETLSCQ
jgi:phosphatidylglycerol---prolipoprotein diacylglyceryl transferase